MGLYPFYFGVNKWIAIYNLNDKINNLSMQRHNSGKEKSCFIIFYWTLYFVLKLQFL